MKNSTLLILLAGTIFISACAMDTIPQEALSWSETTFPERQLQTRRFDTEDENSVLRASGAVLQDLGFIQDAAEAKLGLIVASKDRSAINVGQQVGAFLVAALGGGHVPTDKEQKVRVSVVTSRDKKSTYVRVTFQRTVWNDLGQISKLEKMVDPELYQGFFERLSKAIFLEAHPI